MNKKGIENKLEKCFKLCAAGRTQLRKCVVNAMEAGFITMEYENLLVIAPLSNHK